MVAMRMMQVAAHKIIRMITMGNGFVAAIGAMLVPCVMVTARMLRRTGIGISVRYTH